MKRKRRCNLCGAKLGKDSSVCPECGYNNQAYWNKDVYQNWAEDEEKYRYADFSSQSEETSESEADSEPEAAEEKESRKIPQGALWKEERQKGREKRRRRLGIAVFVVILLSVLPQIVTIVGQYLYRMGSPSGQRVSGVSAYEEVLTLPDEEGEEPEPSGEEQPGASAGESYERELSPGLYVAGIHFPSGTYRGEAVSGGGSLYVWPLEDDDYENIYLYADGEGDERTAKKLSLEPGTTIRIDNDLVLSLYTQDRGELTGGTANSLTREETVENCAVAGEDFEPGTYCVFLEGDEEGYGSLVHRYKTTYDSEDTEYLFFTEEQPEFQNLILKEGDALLTVNCAVRLKPAEYDLEDYRVRPY